jgi:hypothetical protein
MQTPCSRHPAAGTAPSGRRADRVGRKIGQQLQQRGGRLLVAQVPAAGQHAEAAVLQAPAQRGRALRRHHPAAAAAPSRAVRCRPFPARHSFTD